MSARSDSSVNIGRVGWPLTFEGNIGFGSVGSAASESGYFSFTNKKHLGELLDNAAKSLRSTSSRITTQRARRRRKDEGRRRWSRAISDQNRICAGDQSRPARPARRPLASVAKPKWMPSHAARAFRNALADKPGAKFEMRNKDCAAK